MQSKLLAAACLLGSCWLAACTKDQVKEQYTFYTPVYETKAAVINNIRSNAATAIEQPGKLFVKGQYLFLNELNKGVHIIDCSNPAQPKNIAFVNIPGNIDMAVRGNYLYADCYTALAVIDISQPEKVQLKQYINAVFPDRVYTGGFIYDTGRIIVNWKRTDTTIERRFSESFKKEKASGVLFYNDFLQAAASSNGGQTSVNGTGGSMARFALLDNRLYTVGNSELKIFNTTDAGAPFYTNKLQLGWNIETIFPFGKNLFIGSQTGMFIFDASNADNPRALGQFSHARKCDPVIADGQYAYVTLRGGNTCGPANSELDVLDIADLLHPSLLKTYNMKEPRGLSKDGNLLFVCDDGLKIYDATNVTSLALLKQVPVPDTYDVIALHNYALLVAADGLYFINYSNPAAAFISARLPVVKQ